MRFPFIEKHRVQWPVVMMCKVLKVSRSGFYAWRGRPESQQSQRRRKLVPLIQDIFNETRKSYGSPRMYLELVARGIQVSVNFVAKLVRIYYNRPTTFYNF